MANLTPPPPSAAASKPVRVRFGRFELDEANASLTCEGKPIALAPTPFAVLCALVRQGGSLVTKNALLDEVWGHRFVTESVLKTVVGELRTALEDDARQPRFIETVSRRGYRFVASTTAPAPPPRARGGEAAAAGDPSFIGREEALERLHAAWDRACTGKRSIVWVAGEPGIGKTTLIEHFIDHPRRDRNACAGSAWSSTVRANPICRCSRLWGSCAARDPSLATLLRTVAPTWLLQLPWLCTADERDALRHELAGVGPERMLREMGELLDRYTEHRPLLLVTEDLHWSDRATIQLLNYIARRHGDSRLMWLASFRLSEVVALDHPLSPVRHGLRLHRLCDEIVLDPFSESEMARYIAERAPAIAADEAFIRALHERTDGVPLFIAHVMTDLVSASPQGLDGDGAAVRIARMAVPENLAAIIDHYIARLGDEQRAILSAAAVCGVEFRVQTLADVLGSEAAAVAQACDELVREQLWLAAPLAQDGRDAADLPYSFKHALFRQVLYERTAAVARSQLHRKVGSALERERAAGAPIAAAELAMHFERGRDAVSALRYYAEAAEAALLHFSPSEGMALAERGLGLVEQAAPGAERDAVEITLATLQGICAGHLLGVSSGHAKAAYGRAYALLSSFPRHRLRELLLHGLGLTLCMRAEYGEAMELAERCVSLASATNDPLLLLGACTVQGEVLMLQGRPREGVEWTERGLGVIEPLDLHADDSFAPQVTMLGLLGIHLLHLGRVDASRRRLQQARERADRWAQPMAKLIAMWLDALSAVRLGDSPRVAALAEDMASLVEKHALAQGRTAARWFRGWAMSRTGQPREGYRLIREAYEENTRLGMRAGGSEVLGYAADALLLAGDLDAAEAQLSQALRIAETQGERVYLPQLLAIEAAIARSRGRRDDAEASIRRSIAEAREQQAPWLELTSLMELCESVDATARDRRALAALLELLPEATATSTVARARALLDGSKAR